MVQIEQYGPYGSQLPETFRMQLAEGEHISGCSVRHGYIVDAIAFVVTKHDGSTYTVQFGGNGGDETDVNLLLQDFMFR